MLHLNSYRRLSHADGNPVVYVVCGDRVDEDVHALLSGEARFATAVQNGDLDSLAEEGAIVDLCTPTSLHRDTLSWLRKRGFKRFLIEKPMACSSKDLDYMVGSDTVFEVMDNYMFSKATARVLELMADGFTPVTMRSEFSKNRTEDSRNGRGFSNGEAPHAFTVEMPHQLYLATAFLGEGKVISASAEDMETGDSVFRNHGSGRIRLKHGGSVSEHYSNLSASETTRIVRLADDMGNELIVRYFIKGRPLTSSVTFVGKDGSQHVELFERDDMMTSAVSHYYSVLSSGQMRTDRNVAISNTMLIVDALRMACTVKPRDS